MDPQEDIDAAAEAHQQELEWQRQLTEDSGYLRWMYELAAEAVSRQEMKDGDHGKR